MEEFVGRTRELENLESMFADPKFRACAIIGRRRIGKTSLIRKFIEKRKHVYIEFIKSSQEINLRNTSYLMSIELGHQVEYKSFLELFWDLAKLASTDRYVFVLDEYPFVCDREGTISALLQNFLDNGIKDSFVIISGSSIGMIEKEISAYSKPLYGRVRKMYVDELPFEEAMEFHKNLDEMDLLKIHLTVGGIPFYLRNTPAGSYDEYVDRYLIGKDSVFYEEGENLFSREFANSSDYIDIMWAIGLGENEINKVMSTTGINRVTFSKEIKILDNMHFVSRIEPMAGAPKKPIRYAITDSYVSFYYHLIRKLRGSDSRSASALIHSYHGRAFEQFCCKLLKRKYNVVRIGKWWGSIPIRDEEGNIRLKSDGKPMTEETDIDIVAEILKDNVRTMLFAECKFTYSKANVDVALDLQHRMENLSKEYNNRLMIISASGFTDDLIDHAMLNNILLFGPDELFGRKECPNI